MPVGAAVKARLVGWANAVAVGWWRSVILVGLTGLLPLLGAMSLLFGSRFTTSWSSQLVAAPWVTLVAAAGEWALAVWWTVIVVWAAVFLLSRPLTQATRSMLRAWTGSPYPVRYGGPAVLTEMATGY